MREASEARAESEIQEAMGVPPQVESMRPMGMCSRCVDLAAEEEGDGGEVGGSGGVAVSPGGGLVVEGIVVGFFVEDEEMDLGIGC